MEFGRVADIGDLDLGLPPDHPGTAAVLGASPDAPGKPEIRIGLPVWDNDEIARLLFPKDVPRTQRLRAYARQFNAIELNSSGYGLAERSMAKWVSETPPDFRFCPKVPRTVSHSGDLTRATAAYAEFFHTASRFGSRLGRIHLQFPESFGPGRFRELEIFLRANAIRHPLAVEVRHPAWFSRPEIREDYFAMLAELGLTAVIDDTPARRDLIHQRLTVPEAFIRFSGHDRSGKDLHRLEEWVERIRIWLDQGLKRLWFFPHHVPEHVSVDWAVDLITAMNRACGFDLPAPRLLARIEEPQTDLFAQPT